MPRRDNSKNMTIVEVIIVVFVCLFLLAIVPPAFQQSRIDSSRITCRRNLSVMGKVMIIYANDYDDELPRAGGRTSTWSMAIPNWSADNRFAAYGLSADGSGGMATITSSFYLLVKYAEVSPKTFTCPGDSGTTEFKLADDGAGDRELIDLWDFGPEPSRHCSYSYHMPYGLYALTTSSEPGMAVAADRNPWINSPSAARKSGDLLSSYNPEGGKEAVKIGNAIAHEEEGQNVLFLDGHVNFEESPLCGINGDNIYTYWGDGDRRQGYYPIPTHSEPTTRTDSYLVNESAPYRATVTKQAESLDSARAF
jgi:prepilin-type processing-associated H-X9-DG protein